MTSKYFVADAMEAVKNFVFRYDDIGDSQIGPEDGPRLKLIHDT